MTWKTFEGTVKCLYIHQNEVKDDFTLSLAMKLVDPYSISLQYVRDEPKLLSSVNPRRTVD